MPLLSAGGFCALLESKLPKTTMRNWIILLNICLLGASARAQSVEMGFWLGASLYSGDLSPKEFGLYFQEVNPAGGVFGRFNLNNVISLRVGASLAKITGTGDTTETVIRQSFRSNILELAAISEISPFSIGRDPFLVKPYLFGGVAIYRHNPQALFDGSWIDLQPLGTEAQGLPGYTEPYDLTQFSIPFGAGLRFVINDTWALGMEFGWRRTFTDYLDDIGSTLVSYRDVYEGNGSIAAQMSNALIPGPEAGDTAYQRGGEFKDWYYIGGITLSYFLSGSSGYGSGGSRSHGGGRKRGRAISCPKF